VARRGVRPPGRPAYPSGLRDRRHAGEVRERVAEWEETGVTTLLLSLRSPDEVRAIADLLA